jgi:hypothetical protein
MKRSKVGGNKADHQEIENIICHPTEQPNFSQKVLFNFPSVTSLDIKLG